MRIVQIIDSLDAGGAEKMAVNYANALAERLSFSGLITTRKQGQLSAQINRKVSYLFLEKKGRLDLLALFRLRNYLKKNDVDLIHAHSSSFFTAVLIKLTLLRIKIVWHDHYGISQDLNLRKSISLKISSLMFNGVISVNKALEEWASSYLYCSKIKYLPNFICYENNSEKKIELKGSKGKRIICVANLRFQKNHKLLIEAAHKLKENFPDWSFHLFGKDFEDSYSRQLFRQIDRLKLNETVFFYGSVNNIQEVIRECDIAVLPSLSEGLPLAILEYGSCNLPVIATKVGDVEKVIASKNDGIIVESGNLVQFVKALEKLISGESLRLEMGKNLNKIVELKYSEKSVVDDYILWINSHLVFSRNK